jgi:hypothetical protein
MTYDGKLSRHLAISFQSFPYLFLHGRRLKGARWFLMFIRRRYLVAAIRALYID